MSTAQKTASIVHAAVEQERQAVESATAEYVRLITADTGNDNDVKALLNAAGRLKKDAGTINADRAIVAEAQRLASEIARLGRMRLCSREDRSPG
ncbi:MAG: hypothetical protein H7144_14160 [Burkholderiales bacterium]|nr:hypothetical protein [Phycisphaerae bacterium]